MVKLNYQKSEKLKIYQMLNCLMFCNLIHLSFIIIVFNISHIFIEQMSTEEKPEGGHCEKGKHGEHGEHGHCDKGGKHEGGHCDKGGKHEGGHCEKGKHEGGHCEKGKGEEKPKDDK